MKYIVYTKGGNIKPYEWNEEKNKLLKVTRDINFEDVILNLQSGKLELMENMGV